MPGSAPRPSPRRSHLRSADEHTRPYASNANEREFAALADQLDALEHDIVDARSLARRASQGPGLAPHVNHDAVPSSPHGNAVTLTDGAQILIRPIQAEDFAQLRSHFEHLSEVTRYRRFLTAIEHLSTRQLEFLTRIDHETHEAMVAVDPITAEVVGVARYVREPSHAGQAEAVVVVADLWQGRGVGRVLTDRLSARARAAGVDRFSARMLIANRAGRRLLGQVADPISEHEDSGTACFVSRLRHQ